ncbi:MAG: hypothetical protein PHI44_03480 [Candidatus Ratteibacteria bacterium]|nr:hypothetical protein [Candidatus Ratteibacteria bacterium]
MKKTFILLIITLLVAGISYSKDIKNSEEVIPIKNLFEQVSLYDGKEVVVQGEVIGDIMRDGEHFWVNIKDGDAFMGIVIDALQKDKIGCLGRYGIIGDTIKVRGTYHLHCPVHYGERDIHAEKLEVLESGYTVPKPLRIDRIVVSIILGVITIFILLYAQKQSIHRDTDGQQTKK